VDYSVDVPDEDYGGFVDVAVGEKQYTIACQPDCFKLFPVVWCTPMHSWGLSFKKDVEVVQRVAELLL
jgi:hypothetical protein